MAAIDLPPGWPELLSAVVRGPGAWATVDELAERIHTSPATTSAWCVSLEGDGWLTRFPWEGAEVLTLTETAAARLGVGLEPDARGDGEHWSPISAGLRTSFRIKQRHVELTEMVPDPAPGPEEIASAGEQLERRFAGYVAGQLGKRRSIDPDRVPLPTIILTGCSSTWSERTTVPGVMPNRPLSCRCCGLRRISRNTYCARCYRSGWDSFFAAKPARKRRVV